MKKKRQKTRNLPKIKSLIIRKKVRQRKVNKNIKMIALMMKIIKMNQNQAILRKKKKRRKKGKRNLLKNQNQRKKEDTAQVKMKKKKVTKNPDHLLDLDLHQKKKRKKNIKNPPVDNLINLKKRIEQHLKSLIQRNLINCQQ